MWTRHRHLHIDYGNNLRKIEVIVCNDWFQCRVDVKHRHVSNTWSLGHTFGIMFRCYVLVRPTIRHYWVGMFGQRQLRTAKVISRLGIILEFGLKNCVPNHCYSSLCFSPFLPQMSLI